MSQVGRPLKSHPGVLNACEVRRVIDMREGSSHHAWPAAAEENLVTRKEVASCEMSAVSLACPVGWGWCTSRVDERVTGHIS